MSILIILATMGLAMAASAYVRSMVHKYHQVPGTTGYTGAEVAAEILRRNGVRGVTIHEQQGFMGDHYDPTNRRVVLSSEVYHGNSLTALGVAAHEVGHALQHHHAYFPLHLRSLAVGASTFASQLVMWFPMLGMVTGLLQTWVGLGIMAAGWGMIMLFNLVTLPVEYDASRRAKEMLAGLGFVRTDQEAAGVATVLNAAALTYVAAFVTSLGWVLYHLLPLLLGGNRDRE